MKTINTQNILEDKNFNVKNSNIFSEKVGTIKFSTQDKIFSIINSIENQKESDFIESAKGKNPFEQLAFLGLPLNQETVNNNIIIGAPNQTVTLGGGKVVA